MEKAVDWLREHGIAKAEKKQSRIAAEGLCHTPFFRETKNISVQYIIKVIVIFVTAKKKKNCAFCLLAYNGNTIIEIANNQLLIIVKVVP